MNWSKYPFLRLLPFLSLGIVLGEWNPIGNVSPQLLWLLLVGWTVLETLLSRLLRPYRYRWLFGVIALLGFVYLGFFRCTLQKRNLVEVQGEAFVARIFEPPVEKERSVRVVLELRGVRTSQEWRATSGKVMAYLEKSDAACSLVYGDLLSFETPIEEVAPPLNPGEFDYRTFLRRQGITGRVYLKENGWKMLGVNDGHPLFRWSYRFRNQLLEALERCGVTEEAFGTGAALLLGDDEHLPAQQRQHYVAAGAMHVLCVSGMHVGVVYLMASFLLGLLGKSPRKGKLRRILLLLLIWCYALLTGLSPSVLRSSLMLSFLSIGDMIHRKGYALNTVAASAFVLLLINPNNLFAIGFQLSYAAVVGILLLQRPIYIMIFIKNKLLDKVWEITSVALAAQLATMPFTVYYFHQFTPYFWLSNLFMSPLSFVAILSGMGLLMVSWIPWVGPALGKVVWLCLTAMNSVAEHIEQLPLSLVRGLYINKVEFFLCLLLLTLFLVFLHLKKKRLLMELLSVSALLAVSLAFRSQTVARQEKVTVYSLRKHTCLEIMRGSEHLLVCDAGLPADAATIDYSLKPNWARHQLPMNPWCFLLSEAFDHPMAEKRGTLLSAGGFLFAFWDPSAFSETPGRVWEVDYLLVRGKQRPELDRVRQCYQMATLLVDGSVPPHLAAEWQRQAERQGIPSVSIGEGAWTVELKK